jgi:hypothetical protein
MTVTRSYSWLATSAALPLGVYAVVFDYHILGLTVFLTLLIFRAMSQLSLAPQPDQSINNKTSSPTRKTTCINRTPKPAQKPLVFQGIVGHKLEAEKTRSRRSLLNRLTADNVASFASLLSDTVDPSYPQGDLIEIWGLFFEAVQAQTEHQTVFVDLARELSLRWSVVARDLLWKQCQSAWAGACLDFSAENGSRNFQRLSAEEQDELRHKLRYSRKAIATVIGRLTLVGLIDQSAIVAQLHALLAAEPREFAVELVCWVLRALGQPADPQLWASLVKRRGSFSPRIRFLIDEVQAEIDRRSNQLLI